MPVLVAQSVVPCRHELLAHWAQPTLASIMLSGVTALGSPPAPGHRTVARPWQGGPRPGRPTIRAAVEAIVAWAAGQPERPPATDADPPAGAAHLRQERIAAPPGGHIPRRVAPPGRPDPPPVPTRTAAVNGVVPVPSLRALEPTLTSGFARRQRPSPQAEPGHNAGPKVVVAAPPTPARPVGRRVAERIRRQGRLGGRLPTAVGDALA
jgi:hypothetical protein